MSKRLICLLSAVLLMFALALPVAAEVPNDNSFKLTVHRQTVENGCTVTISIERLEGADPIGLFDFTLAYDGSGYNYASCADGALVDITPDADAKTLRLTKNALETNWDVDDEEKQTVAVLNFTRAENTDSKIWLLTRAEGTVGCVTSPGYCDEAELVVEYQPPTTSFCDPHAFTPHADGKSIKVGVTRFYPDSRIYCAAYSAEKQMLAFAVLPLNESELTLKCDTTKVDTLKFFCLGSRFEPLFLHIEKDFTLE